MVVKDPAGVPHAYRLNVYNFNFPVSDAAYNDHFYVFYCLELIALSQSLFSIMLFDPVTVTMCFGYLWSVAYDRRRDPCVGPHPRVTAGTRCCRYAVRPNQTSIAAVPDILIV